uniref:40S ribosomal protein S12 n=2 Tax=Oryza meridionalis TaxID=40149 RepID=A0A0E0E7G1_9ORYZ
MGLMWAKKVNSGHYEAQLGSSSAHQGPIHLLPRGSLLTLLAKTLTPPPPPPPPPLFRHKIVSSQSVSGLLSAEMAEETPVETPAAPVLGEPMDLMTALQLVMKKSSAHDGLVKGLREAAKAIEKHAAQLCVLAEDCDQPDYVKLVKALCAEHNVHLVTVPSAKSLGEWAGLCKIDSEGKARKVVGCSCVVVKDYGEESEGLNIVQDYVKSH